MWQLSRLTYSVYRATCRLAMHNFTYYVHIISVLECYNSMDIIWKIPPHSHRPPDRWYSISEKWASTSHSLHICPHISLALRAIGSYTRLKAWLWAKIHVLADAISGSIECSLSFNRCFCSLLIKVNWHPKNNL